jgi:hypothetical protein
MTLTIVATAAATDANAYCTLAEAEAYVATLCFSDAWTGKTDEQKKAAIISAARWMDTLPWRGVRTGQTQSMAWPRCEYLPVRFVDLTVQASGYLLDRDGYQIASDEVPACVKNANAEMALRLLAKDRATDGKVGMKIGPVTTATVPRHLIPPSVLDLVGFLLAFNPQTGGRLVRG